MADEIKLKAPTVEQQVNVVINGEEKLKSFASTLEKISSNKNLHKYFKDQKQLIKDVSNAYGNFTKTASKDNALELMKTTNALKALSDVDISSLIPDFKNFSQALENANRVAGNLDSAFSVSSFKDAFSAFETLRAYSVDLDNLFKHFELDINVTNLQESLRLAERETRRVKRELSETQEELSSKKIELASFIDGSGLTEQVKKLKYLEDEISHVREQASEEFRDFLIGNDFSGWDLDENGAFERYFNEIKEGSLTAKEAIAKFKFEYSYLLQDKFSESGGLFNLQQVQEFENKLESVFTRVEEISRQMNDIVENGVMTKAMQNLSVDSSISQTQKDLFTNVLKDEESLSSIESILKKIIDESVNLQNTNNKTFDEEQFSKLLVLFEKIESSLSSMKTVFVDIGDGEEFSPLLKMIDNVQSSIKELSTSVKGIGINMNIDVGSNTEMESKVQSKISNALQAYQRLFEHIKMSSVGGSAINTNFFEFDINQYDTMMGKLQAYRKFIRNMREEAKKRYGKDVLFQDTDKSYWNSASAAMAQVTRAFNEMNASSDANPLENLFGGKTDLTEVVDQLKFIADKLGEISTTASEFKNVFKEGFNVTASVEEIEKLTSRVKELEDELSKVKLNPSVGDKSNISSPIKDVFQEGTESPEMDKVATATEEAVQAKKDFATTNEGVQDSVDGSKSKLELETELMERLAKSAREAADAKKEFVEANKEVKDSVDDTGKSAKKDKYKDKAKISEDDYIQRAYYFSSIANQKLTDSGNTILGNNVSTELVDGLVKVNAKIKDADGSWKTFSAKIDADGNMFEQRFRTITKNVDKLESELENFGRETSPALTYQETLDKANDIRRSLNLGEDFQIKVDSNELVTITKKISDVDSATTSVTQTFRSAEDAIQNFGQLASNSAEKTSVALKGVKQSADASVDAVKEEKLSLSSMQTEIDNLNKKSAAFKVKPDNEHSFDSWKNQLKELDSLIDQYQNRLNTIQTNGGGIVGKDDEEEIKRIKNNLQALVLIMSKTSSSERGWTDVAAKKTAERLNELLEKNPKLAKEAKDQIRAYYNELTNGNPSKPLNEIYEECLKIVQAQRELGNTGKGFFDILGDKVFLNRAAQLASYYLSLTDFIRYGQEAVRVVRELDTALTELRKVSDVTEQRLSQSFKTSAGTAKELGSSISNVISATADWSRMGYDIIDSEELARVSTLYKNVGDGIDIEAANNSLISTLQGFKMDASEAIEIVDKYNEVANNYAINSAGIGEALQRSAASFNAANTDLSKSIALITTTNEVVQNPEAVGTLWKTLSARIRGKIVPIYNENYSLCA